MFNLLLEATPIIALTGETVTVHMSSRHASPAGVYLDGKEWLPAITGWDGDTLSLTSNGQTQQAQVSYGNLTFHIQSALDNMSFPTLVWDGALISIWEGTDGDPFESYTKVFTGVGGAVSTDGVEVSLPLLGSESLLTSANILAAKYNGTGGPEGNLSLLGNLKPWCSGLCEYIDADSCLIDSTYQVYQFHGYGPTGGAQDVLEFGISINGSAGPATIVNSYAELIALTMTDGTWASAPSVGMFRLANAPSKKLSALVLGAMDGSTVPQTIDTIAAHLLKQAGIPAAQIDMASLSAFSTYQWCDFITDQTNIGDVLRQMLFEANGYLLADANGVWKAGRFFGSNDQGELRSDRTAGPLVKKWTQQAVQPPVYSVRIGADRCWNPHDESDISPALVDISDQMLANEKAISDALVAVQDAKALAAEVQQQIDETVQDGILDRAEKINWNRRYAEESQNHVTLMSQNTQFNVDTQRAAYDAAFTALTNYLNSMSPAFADTSQSTVIVASDFDKAWNDLETAKIALLTAESGFAATVSTWDGVTGTTKPADNATVGAPTGTIVGDRNAEDVVAQIDQNGQTIIEQALRGDDIQAVMDARTYLNGVDVGTVVKNLQTQVIDNDTAYQSNFSLLGGKSGDNQSWVMNLDKVQDSNGQSIADMFKSINATTLTAAANVAQLAQVYANADGTAKALFTLTTSVDTSNGSHYVSGFTNTVTGAGSSFDILADHFSIVSTSGGTPFTPFEITNGVVKMHSVEVDSIKVGTGFTNGPSAYAQRTDKFSGQGAGNWVSCMTATVVLVGTGIVHIISKGSQSFPNGDKTWNARLTINGSVVDAAGGEKTDDTFTLMGPVQMNAGTYTISMDYASDSSVSVVQRSIMAWVQY